MISDAVKIEREKRKTAREAALLDLLKRPEVLAPILGIGGFMAIAALGKSRTIDRDSAGFLAGLAPVLAAASLGVKDKYALLGIYGAATTAYCLGVPPQGDEIIIDTSKLWGGDGKLFGLTMPTWLGGGPGT